MMVREKNNRDSSLTSSFLCGSLCEEIPFAILPSAKESNVIKSLLAALHKVRYLKKYTARNAMHQKTQIGAEKKAQTSPERYQLSLRDGAEMVLERGWIFTHEAGRDWEARFAPLLTDQLRAKAAWTARSFLVC